MHTTASSALESPTLWKSKVLPTVDRKFCDLSTTLYDFCLWECSCLAWSLNGKKFRSNGIISAVTPYMVVKVKV